MIHIPIVMATDNNYIPLAMALTSLVCNAGKNTFYNIYILISSDFSQDSAQVIKECMGNYKTRCKLNFKDVGNIFDNVTISISHITQPTFYRLAIPDLIEEDKCIYLDTDTIIMSDLEELYNIPLGECYVAGARHFEFILSSDSDEYCMAINLPGKEQYINAGILVMNLKEMRKNQMTNTFLDLIPQNMPTQDQDIINKACYGKIAFIPFKYNVMTKLAGWNIEDYKGMYPDKDLKQAWNEPCIIHYLTSVKPWNSAGCEFMEYWWNVCKKTQIYKYIVTDFLKDMVLSAIYKSHQGMLFTKKLPAIFDITYKRNYVVYGAGKRARLFIQYMKRAGVIPQFVIVSNMKDNPLEIEGISVKVISEVSGMLYDKTIIIATSEEIHMEIIRSMHEYDYKELLPLSDKWNVN